MKRYITFLTIAVSLVLQACAVKVEPEDACHFEQNSLQQRVSWESSVPVKLHIHKDVPAEFHQDIRDAAEEWNTAMRRDLFVIVDDLFLVIINFV